MACTQQRRKAKGIYSFFLCIFLLYLHAHHFCKCQPGQGSLSYSLQQKGAPGSRRLGEATSDAVGIHEAESTSPQTASGRPGADVSPGPKAADNKVNISIKAQPGVCRHHLVHHPLYMGAGALGSRAECFLMISALNRDEEGCGKVVFIRAWPMSPLLAAAQCQSCAELLWRVRGELQTGAAS